MNKTNKEELIQKTCQYLQELQKGNDESFTELYHVTSGYLYLLLQKWGVDEEDQPDVLQEIYCNISQSISKLEQPQAGLAWIMSIAKHKAMDYLRKKYKEKDRFVYLDAADQEDESDMELESDVFELPENVMESRETQRILRTFLEELPENQRMVLEARFFNDMSINEIAAAFGMNPNTVKTNLSRAKAGFKEKVENYQKTTGIKLRSISIIPVLYLLLEKEIKQAFAQTLSMQQLIEQQLQHSMAGQIGAGAKTAAKLGKTVVSSMKAKIAAGCLGLALLGGGVAAVIQYSNSGSEPAEIQSTETVQESGKIEGSETANEEIIETQTPTVAPTPTPVPEDLATTSQLYMGPLTNVEKQEDGTYLLSFDRGVTESYTISKEEYSKLEEGSILDYSGMTLYCIYKENGDYWFVQEEYKDRQWQEIKDWTQTYLVSERYQYKGDIVVMRHRYEADSIWDVLVSGSKLEEKDRVVVPGSTMLHYTDTIPSDSVMIEKESMISTTLEEFYGSDKNGAADVFYKMEAAMYGFEVSDEGTEYTTWRNLGDVFVTVSENGDIEIHECLAFADGDIWAWALEEFYPEYYFD